MQEVKMFLRSKNKKQAKIKKFRLDGLNRLWLRVEGKEEQELLFDEDKYRITVGSKEIMPLYSYMINSWNVLLPFIAYKEDEENIKNYLKSIGSTMYDKKTA